MQDEWYKHVKDNKRRPVRLGGENRWFFGELGFLFNKNEKALSRRWIMLTMIDGYIAERQAYAAIGRTRKISTRINVLL